MAVKETRMVTTREKLGNVIRASVRAHTQTVSEHLGEVLAFFLQEGEAPLDLSRTQVTLAAFLEAAKQRMVAADETHLAEAGGDQVPRERRDQATEALYDLVVKVRASAATHFGTTAAEALLGIEGTTARDPIVLRRQAERLIERLGDPELVLPPLEPTASPFDPALAVDALRPALATLVEALEEVEVQRRLADATLEAKTEAMEAYDFALSNVARILIGFYNLAGHRRLARALRLFRGSTGTGAGEPEGEAEEAPASEAPSPAAGAASEVG